MWRAHPGNTTPAAWHSLRATLDALLPAAAGAQVRLGIEPEPGNVIRDAPARARLLAELGADARHLAVVLDPANLLKVATLPRQQQILEHAFGLLGQRPGRRARQGRRRRRLRRTRRGGMDYDLVMRLHAGLPHTVPVIAQDLTAEDATRVSRFLADHAAPGPPHDTACLRSPAWTSPAPATAHCRWWCCTGSAATAASRWSSSTPGRGSGAASSPRICGHTAPRGWTTGPRLLTFRQLAADVEDLVNELAGPSRSWWSWASRWARPSPLELGRCTRRRQPSRASSSSGPPGCGQPHPPNLAVLPVIGRLLAEATSPRRGAVRPDPGVRGGAGRLRARRSRRCWTTPPPGARPGPPALGDPGRRAPSPARAAYRVAVTAAAASEIPFIRSGRRNSGRRPQGRARPGATAGTTSPRPHANGTSRPPSAGLLHEVGPRRAEPRTPAAFAEERHARILELLDERGRDPQHRAGRAARRHRADRPQGRHRPGPAAAAPPNPRRRDRAPARVRARPSGAHGPQPRRPRPASPAPAWTLINTGDAVFLDGGSTVLRHRRAADGRRVGR